MKRFLLIALYTAGTTPLLAQTPATADSTQPAPTAVPRVQRASWTSDRLPLQVGDLVTVIVDEATAASEHVSQVATGSRSQKAGLNASVIEDQRLGPAKSFATGLSADSRDIGDANRRGALTAVLTVRVKSIEPSGIVHLAGSKKVNVDGRQQEVALEGVARPEDIRGGNSIFSDRIAEAVITYRGKKIGPRSGILGRILSILWP